MFVRLIVGCSVAVGCLFLGKWLRHIGWLDHQRAQRWIRWLVRFPVPTTLCLSLWNLRFQSTSAWSLPLIGFMMVLSPILPAWLYARYKKLSRPEKGSFITCAAFSNVGYFGAFVAFAVFGEQAYALCIFYMTLFNPGFYTLGFWLAARYGSSNQNALAQSLSSLRWIPIAGMVLGLTLNLLQFERPQPLAWLNQTLIPLMTVLYLTAIGSELTFNIPKQTYPHCLAMCGIKFLYAPLVALFLASVFHITGFERMIILLEASTPVAVSPLIFPLLFGMDRQLSSALWLSTTLVALPWFIFLVPRLSGWLGV